MPRFCYLCIRAALALCVMIGEGVAVNKMCGNEDDEMMGVSLTMPVQREVHLAYVNLEQPYDVIQQLEGTLSAEEWARAGRFHFAEDARRYIVRRGCLRHLLGHLLQVAPWEISFVLGAQGKPRLAVPFDRSGLSFNLSDSGEMALFAWTTGGEIGVDIEQLRALPDAEALAQRFFAPPELDWLMQQPVDERSTAFYRTWTCKEAALKALGDGLTAPLDAFVAAHWRVPARIEWLRATPASMGQWKLHLLDAPAGWLAALVTPAQIDKIWVHRLKFF